MMVPTVCAREADEDPTFLVTLERHGLGLRRRDALRVLQVNVGKLCNQTCVHCDLVGDRIATGPHCFGCTAGHGASCGGTLA